MKGAKYQYLLMEDLLLGGRHTIQYTEDVPQNRLLETYIILLSHVTPINLL